eukprot:GHRR01035479.1.p1 GENE.GHRR01035479.1~~GHRR01035479.1.p1  ORF type:complete len:211 (+),score=53.20 GHRR01035479.1:466-1098(+)
MAATTTTTAATGQNGTFAGSSTAELEQWLERHGIQTALYGQGSARNITELFEEVSKAESVLAVFGSGPCSRAFRLVSVLNLYIKNGQGQVLIEAGQRLPDGRLRQRGLPLSEKMMGQECWQAAAVRAVGEELATVLPRDWQLQLHIDESTYSQAVEIQESTSYPGLLTQVGSCGVPRPCTCCLIRCNWHLPRKADAVPMSIARLLVACCK